MLLFSDVIPSGELGGADASVRLGGGASSPPPASASDGVGRYLVFGRAGIRRRRKAGGRVDDVGGAIPSEGAANRPPAERPSEATANDVKPPTSQSRLRGRGLQLIARAIQVLLVLAALLWIGASVSAKNGPAFIGLAFVPFFAAITIGAWLNSRARRHLARTASFELSRDSRPPVLYLRSFDADVQFQKAKNGVPPELQLCWVLSRLGPVVA